MTIGVAWESAESTIEPRSLITLMISRPLLAWLARSVQKPGRIDSAEATLHRAKVSPRIGKPSPAVWQGYP
jgi:hypothetical protein